MEIVRPFEPRSGSTLVEQSPIILRDIHKNV